MSDFKRGRKVVKVINVMGSETATVQTIESIKKGVVRLVDYSLTYDAKSGREIDAVIPGCSSRLIPFDGDGECDPK